MVGAGSGARATREEPSIAAGNHCSEIAVSPNGRWLYVANRGHDSLSLFATADETGDLTLKANIPCGGKTPRRFAFDPTGAYLAVANQDSDVVALFAADPTIGDLRAHSLVKTGTPTAVAFAAPKPATT